MKFERLFMSNKKIKLREIKTEEHFEKELYSIREELLLPAFSDSVHRFRG